MSLLVLAAVASTVLASGVLANLGALIEGMLNG